MNESTSTTGPVEPHSVVMEEATNRLFVEWSDGVTTQYPIDWLRWQCPCALCRGEMGQPGRLDYVKTLTPQETTLENVQPVGRYAIMPFWADGHHDGIFTYQWLRANSQDDAVARPQSQVDVPPEGAAERPARTHLQMHSVNSPSDKAFEARIEAAIEPWLAHMTWRNDFAQWRDRRIWQERHQSASVKAVRAALGPEVRGKRVLDLGAGMGGLSVALMLEPGIEGLRLEAIDYNPDYCRIARLRAERYGLRLPIVVAAGEQLPYVSCSFDLVICMDVLEHVADAPAVLGEMHRVLRAGGTVLTTVPNRHAFRDPHYHLPLINWLPRPLAERIVERAGRSKAGSPLHDRQALSELNSYTWSRFERLAGAAGFRVTDQVFERIRGGEIRLLTGIRRALLTRLAGTLLLRLLYNAYRYGWQGTFQIMLVKPR